MKARDGLYTQFEFTAQARLAKLLMRYFRKEENGWRINETIRGMVQYREWNLLADLRPLGQFDIVFCRNVLIYFDQPTKAKVLEAIAQQMAADGMLYLGGAETVLGISRPVRAAGHGARCLRTGGVHGISARRSGGVTHQCMPPRAAIGHRHSTRPLRTPTYQS